MSGHPIPKPFALVLPGRASSLGNKRASVGLPKDIDPGIRRMVEILNAKGLTTQLSCEGHKEKQTGYCHRAYVTIEPEAFQKYIETKADRLREFLDRAATVSLVIRYHGVTRPRTRKYIPQHAIVQPAFVFPPHWTEEGVIARPNEKEERRTWMRRWEKAAKKFL